MSFLKYPSIDNHYRSKEIAMWLGYHPELESERYVAREKLDGSNMAVWFLPDMKIKFAGRNNFIGYYGDDVRYQGVNLKKMFIENALLFEFITHFQALSIALKKTVIVFGEVFGKGIQNRVYYGEQHYWRAYDIMIDGVMVSQKEFEDHFKKIRNIGISGWEQLVCPLVGVFDNLEDGLKFDVEHRMSLLTPTGYIKRFNQMEGVVLKPYAKAYQSPQGSVFYLKIKADSFKDAEKERKSEKKAKDVDPTLAEYHKDFLTYLNRNRVLDVFSKNGQISKPSQIGEYIRMVIEDAKEDFLKDNEDYLSSKPNDRVVFNGGDSIVKLLKEFL